MTKYSKKRVKTINGKSLLGKEENIVISGEGGTSDYNALTNQPKINSVTLTGNKSLTDLGIQKAGDYALSSDIPTKTSELTNDSGYITSSYHDNTKQDVIENLSTIESNASAGKTASDTISNYGDIVTHNASEFYLSTNPDGYITSSYHDFTKQNELTSSNAGEYINISNTDNVTVSITYYADLQEKIISNTYNRNGSITLDDGVVYPKYTNNSVTPNTMVIKNNIVYYVDNYNNAVVLDIPSFQHWITESYDYILGVTYSILNNVLISADLSTKQDIISDLDTIRTNANLVTTKQDTLVSGTNIKTINNQSLLGEGNITIEGGGGSTYTAGDNITIEDNVINAKSTDCDCWEWTEVTKPSWFSGMCYGDGKFWATYTADGATITSLYYTEDGLSWTEGSLPTTTTYVSITYGNGKLVLSNKGYGGIYSEDGVNWTEFTISSTTTYTSICFRNGKFIAYSVNSTNQLAFSDDLINWTETTAPVNFNDVAYGNGKYVLSVHKSSYNTTYCSEDLLNWTEVTLPIDMSAGSVRYGDGKFLIFKSFSNTYLYSEDLINWTEITAPVESIANIEYGDDRFLMTGANSRTAAYSKDGINWTEVFVYGSYYSTYLSLLAYGNGKFVGAYTYDYYSYVYQPHLVTSSSIANTDLSNISDTAKANFANSDLSNLSDKGVSKMDGRWWLASYTVSENKNIAKYEHDISDYLPDDNYIYEVMGTIYISRTDSSSTNSGFYVYDSMDGGLYSYPNAYIGADGANFQQEYSPCILIVDTSRKIYSQITSYKATATSFKLYRYRRVGTNEYK